jgi:RNA polymerase sigma-70 factor, ECF subfamily
MTTREDKSLRPGDPHALLAAAQRGDEGAFEALIEPYRSELHAHCYRMLGSVHDAEDALQDALVRAWRGIGRFEGRSSLRSWLYRIATNSSLRLIERRPRRMLPIDHGPASDPHDALGTPLVESTWIEPYPDEQLGLEDGLASPEARYEQRESVELAFTAAVQHLPPLQRAALIMSDVLGFAPAEVAEALDASPASIYSALQRARKATAERLPEQSQQQTLRALGDERVSEVVGRFVEAWEGADFEAIRSMLTEDAVLAMPPWPNWFRGRDTVVEFLAERPLIPERTWGLVSARASGQIVVGCYARTEAAAPLAAADLMVLTLAKDGRIAELTAFREPKLFSSFGLPDALAAMDSGGDTDL